ALDTLLIDLRHAGRRLRRQSFAAAVIVTTIAMVIGGATTLFCIVNAQLLRPLPYPEASRTLRLTAGPVDPAVVPELLRSAPSMERAGSYEERRASLELN